jgi:hypothetical protein
MTGAGDAAKEYAAGCAAGIAQVAVGHPFDTVKVACFCLSFLSYLPVTDMNRSLPVCYFCLV